MNRILYRLAISFGCIVGLLFLTKNQVELPSKSARKLAQDTLELDTKKVGYSPPNIPYLLQQPSKNRLYQCTISTAEKIYTTKDKIIVDVKIKNSSKQNINLIGSIDGSDTKIKLPFCLFIVQKENETVQHHGFIGCGNVLNLRPSDFIEIGINESFSPFVEGETYSAFGTIIGNKIALQADFFDGAGKYKIQFVYSTLSDQINDFLGYDLASYSKEELDTLSEKLENVPRIQLYSNILEVELE